VIRLLCSPRVIKAAKKSKHGVGDQCRNVKLVLHKNPEFGQVVARHPPIRKMRVRVPGLAKGKRGGYRLTYQAREVDETMHIVLLDLYYKGDRDDLSDADYKAASQYAAKVLGDVMAYGFEDFTPEDP
jgi:mRNA-degrading endonuclease RelE of RelBE toxin-antitoxin system